MPWYLWVSRLFAFILRVCERAKKVSSIASNFFLPKFVSFLKTNRQCLEYQDISEAKQAREYSETLPSP